MAGNVGEILQRLCKMHGRHLKCSLRYQMSFEPRVLLLAVSAILTAKLTLWFKRRAWAGCRGPGAVAGVGPGACKMVGGEGGRGEVLKRGWYV